MSNITNESVSELIAELYRAPDDALAAMRNALEEEGIPIIRRDTERLIVTLLKKNKPERILELGTAAGYSAAVMAKTLPQAGIITVDSDDRAVRRASAAMDELGHSGQVRVIGGEASAVMDRMIFTGEEHFDFVFIDAGKSHYREFWDRAVKLTGHDSLIVCDNVFMDGAVADESFNEKGHRNRTILRNMGSFLEYLVSWDGAETCVLPAGDGLTISWIK